MREECEERRKERDRETEEGKTWRNSSGSEADKRGILWHKEKHRDHMDRMTGGNKLDIVIHIHGWISIMSYIQEVE